MWFKYYSANKVSRSDQYCTKCILLPSKYAPFIYRCMYVCVCKSLPFLYQLNDRTDNFQIFAPIKMYCFNAFPVLSSVHVTYSPGCLL